MILFNLLLILTSYSNDNIGYAAEAARSGPRSSFVENGADFLRAAEVLGEFLGDSFSDLGVLLERLASRTRSLVP